MSTVFGASKSTVKIMKGLLNCIIIYNYFSPRIVYTSCRKTVQKLNLVSPPLNTEFFTILIVVLAKVELAFSKLSTIPDIHSALPKKLITKASPV